MITFFKRLWQRLFPQDQQTEVDRITTLQRLAVVRRREYAQNVEQAGLRNGEPEPEALTSSRMRMVEAEAAHTTALRQWENKQARQRSY